MPLQVSLRADWPADSAAGPRADPQPALPGSISAPGPKPALTPALMPAATTRSHAVRRSTGSTCWPTAFDTAFVVPGTGVRFGVEFLLRLVPVAGDAAASALSCYLLYEAYRLGVPRTLLARMLANVLLEGAVGAVPLAGDAFDVLFRANRRNVMLLREHFARTGFA